ncbi:MAG TPA: carbohydrate ABC transporter permease [Candidatus Acetothermia bacterium]|nr:carbohydrate ABC transporter permease [Candidatus Acetothermia bacterium]
MRTHRRLWRHVERAVPYLLLACISAPFLIMYVGFFLRAFGEGMLLGIVPQKWGFSNFQFLWKPIAWGLGQTTMWAALGNTILFAVTSGVVVTVICMLAGYALSRIEFPGRNFYLTLQLVLHAVPGQILLIAIFFLLLYVGLLHRLPGVALARASLEIPLGIWMAKGFFDGIPWDVERSAMVDGCTRFQVWYKIFLPLVKPGIAAVFIWGFLFAWHDFIYVYTLLPGTVKVMSTLIQSLLATEVIDYGYLAALSLVYTLPPLTLFVFLQRALLKVPVFGGKGLG